MAIKLIDQYPGRADAPSIDYPNGSFKNRSAPGVLDGTPLDKAWANDKEGFFQGILAEAEITADGHPDKVGASQYLDALKSVIAAESPPTEFATQAEFDAHTSNDKAVSPFVMQPSTQGNAVLTGSNNVVAMADIVTSLGLEKGDVIQIKIASLAYDKLHTVESITNDGQIVVNYEHCGTRGNGSLKLPDYTGSILVKRLAKWYNAADGLGQAWVNITAFRVINTQYTNATGRNIIVAVFGTTNSGTRIIVDGAKVAANGFNVAEGLSSYSSIGSGSVYKFEVALTICMEKR